MPNWVDLLLLILLFRGCYVGIEHGAFAALLNGLAAVSATVLTMNTAPVAWSTAHAWLPVRGPVVQAVMFWTLFVVSLLILQALVRRLTSVVKWERLHWTTQGLGLLLGAARGVWWIAVALTACASSGLPYLQASAGERSVVGTALREPARELLAIVADRFPGAAGRGETLIPSWVQATRDQKRR
ncbi:MAG: CvpA family protein [Candidatus Omnitrophica bacterium]|nr:CvpA family protein [Candidatus Omnitrophota bacterium]